MKKIRECAIVGWTALLLTILLLFGEGAIVYGAPNYGAIGLNGKHSAALTLIFQKEVGDKMIPIPQAEFSIYKVADLTEDGNYEKAEPFRDVETAPFDQIKTAEELLRAARIYKKAVGSLRVKGQTGLTDKEGKVSFGPIECQDFGVYLVLETGKEGQSPSHKTAEPFLILLPGAENGKWVYDQVAYPKTTDNINRLPSPTPSGEPSPPPKPGVKTSDNSKIGVWIWLFTVFGLFFTGLLKFRKS